MSVNILSLEVSTFITEGGEVLNGFKGIVGKTDSQVATLWRRHKDDLLSFREETNKARRSTSAKKTEKRATLRAKCDSIDLKIEVMKAAYSRQQSEFGKKGAAKVADRKKKTARFNAKAKAKADHVAKIAARKAKREAEKLVRAERTLKYKEEMAKSPQQGHDVVILTRKGRSYKVSIPKDEQQTADAA